jgi:heavy metal-binding protein
LTNLPAGTLAVSLLAALGAPSGQTAAQPVTLRFHHLHYRVPDPGAALGAAADAFRGTRTILQGLGVGVRVGRQYVLFDRDESTGRSSRGREPAAAYTEAARWLAATGVRVDPASLADTAVARPFPGAVLDHIAFAADDARPIVASLSATPFLANEDRARFRLASGLVVEIVRDTDRPDAYWCPMHPGVRSPATGKCPLCAMALVPIAPPRIGEYKVDVALRPGTGGGASGVEITVRDPDSGDPVTNFIDVHERRLHLFIISRDLARFAHVHPTPRADGVFELRHELTAGEYVLIADFLPAGGTSQLVQRAVVTPGYRGALFGPPAELASTPFEQVVGGLRVRMDAPSPLPRRETGVRFHVTDAATSLPVTDLEPYLGASGHLLIVNDDLTAAIHAHPDGAATSGPVVAFAPAFPAPGRYKVWAQFQRKGAVITAAFVIDVPQS